MFPDNASPRTTKNVPDKEYFHNFLTFLE